MTWISLGEDSVTWSRHLQTAALFSRFVDNWMQLCTLCLIFTSFSLNLLISSCNSEIWTILCFPGNEYKLFSVWLMKFLLGGEIVVYNDNAHIILFKYIHRQCPISKFKYFILFFNTHAITDDKQGYILIYTGQVLNTKHTIQFVRFFCTFWHCSGTNSSISKWHYWFEVHRDLLLYHIHTTNSLKKCEMINTYYTPK